jgi:hypothetical protein
MQDADPAGWSARRYALDTVCVGALDGRALRTPVDPRYLGPSQIRRVEAGGRVHNPDALRGFRAVAKLIMAPSGRVRLATVWRLAPWSLISAAGAVG